MLRVWALLGVAFVMLTAPAGAVVPTPSGTLGSSSLAELAAVAAGDLPGAPSAEPCVQTRDDRARILAHELADVELELDDGDARSDVAALPTASAPAFEPVRIARIPAHGSADTGHPRVASALARGPPVAG